MLRPEAVSGLATEAFLAEGRAKRETADAAR